MGRKGHEEELIGLVVVFVTSADSLIWAIVLALCLECSG